MNCQGESGLTFPQAVTFELGLEGRRICQVEKGYIYILSGVLSISRCKEAQELDWESHRAEERERGQRRPGRWVGVSTGRLRESSRD